MLITYLKISYIQHIQTSGTYQQMFHSKLEILIHKY